MGRLAQRRAKDEERRKSRKSSTASQKVIVESTPEGATINGVAQKNVIAPCYHHLVPMMQRGESTHFVLKGGRGSAKSSFCAIQVVAHILTHPLDHAVVLVKVARNIKDSISNNLLWAIELFGLEEAFTLNKTTRQLTYTPTGQTIMFKGCDNPSKLKSIKPPPLKKNGSESSPSGRFGVLWFEELDQFSCADEVRSVVLSFLRGAGDESRQIIMYSFNPPQRLSHWLNAEFLLASGQVVTHTTYLDTPREWHTAAFLAETEDLKEKNERSYRATFLGEIISQGREVFENVANEPISDEFIASRERTQKGVDWGFRDPMVALECWYDKENLIVYVFKEFYKTRASIESLAEWMLKETSPKGRVLCDSAEPRNIKQLKDLGITNASAVSKGSGSVRSSLVWLSLHCAKIVVDAKRCPNTHRELISYEFEQNRDGVVNDEPPDKNNHAIDALRYAMERIMKARG